MSRLSELKVVVEVQQGRCRALATAMDDLANCGGMLSAERRILQSYAEQALAIADALGEALRDGDFGRLRRIWNHGRVVVGAAGLAVVASGTGTVVDDLLSNPTPIVVEAPDVVVRCLTAAHQGFSLDLEGLIADTQAQGSAEADAGVAEGTGTAQDSTVPSEQKIEIGIAEETDAALSITAAVGDPVSITDDVSVALTSEDEGDSGENAVEDQESDE